MLILKYERKDFFNQRVYTEDKRSDYNREDLKKVFLFFSKNRDASVQIDNIVIFWDGLSEYENRIVTVRYFDKTNYLDIKKSYDMAKKESYAMA